MEIKIAQNGSWYHGSNVRREALRARSTVTHWRELAEAFSHKPKTLSYDGAGRIFHDGGEKGYLYVVDEPVAVGTDIYQHPRTTMALNAELLTARELKVKMIAER